MKKIMDPTIRAQLKKVEVVADPEIEKVFPALQRVIVNLTTIDGRTFTKQLDYPKGDPRNPLSDAEVEEKFAALAEGVLSEGAQKKLKDAIWNLEKSWVGEQADGADEGGRAEEGGADVDDKGIEKAIACRTTSVSRVKSVAGASAPDEGMRSAGIAKETDMRLLLTTAGSDERRYSRA